MENGDIKRAEIRIRVREHKATGLLLATSEELRGLAVHARTYDELDRRLPGLITDLMAAEGKHVIRIETEPDRRMSEEFGPRDIIASAALEAA